MADSLQIKLGITGADKVAAGIEKLAASASQLKYAFAGVGAAVAAATGLSSLGQAAIATARLGGQLSDLSARTGMSTKSLIVLRQAFQDAGVGADRVGQSVSLLQKNLFEAATAGGAGAAALADIGLSAADLVQLAPEDQFQRVAKAISDIQSPAQRAATAMAIFGKGGADLLPLFAEGGAIDSARESLGKLPEVLSRNVPILDSISDAFDRLPNKATQLFAGIADQLAPAIASILDFADKIDLTGIGQKIGAFVNVAIDAFKAGKLTQLITLTIEAGFEYGMNAAKDLWQKLVDWIGDTFSWSALGDLWVTAWTTQMKYISHLILNLIVPFSAVADWVKNAFKYVFQEVTNSLAGGLASVINWFSEKSNSLFGTNFGKFQANMTNDVAPPDFSKSWEVSKQGADAGKEYVDSFFDGIKDAYRQATGRAEGLGIGNTAGEKLKSLIDQQLLLRELIDLEDQLSKIENEEFKTDVKVFNFKLEMQKQELAYAKQIQTLNLEKGKIESDWLMSSTEKYKAKKAILDAELAATVHQIQALKELRAQTSNPEEQQTIDQKVSTLTGQAGGLTNQMQGMGPDPTSYTQQFAAAFTSLQEQAAITARSVAQTFADVFNSAIQSISNGITGLIMGTKSWGQALMEIGTSIVTSIVSAIVQMGVRWIATQILMATVGKSVMAAAVAASAPMAAAQAAIWSTPATLATIASYGAAAAAAPGFIAASQGIVMAQSMAAFREGGYTGDGNPDSVAGIVHRGEYVVPADAVDRIGVSTLEAISSGSSPSAAPVMTSASAPSPITLNMGVFDDPRRLSDWARSNEGRTVLVDILRQHAHEFRA